MALSIDNFDNAASGAGVSSLAVGTRLNGGGAMTLTAGDILLIMVGTSNPSTRITVSSISDTASLTWAKRSSGVCTNGQFTTPLANGELWWAYCGTAQTGYQATVHLSASADVVSISIIAVKGFQGSTYPSNPFDPNGVLPHVGTSSTSSVPGATVSTTNPNTMLIGGCMVCANSVSGVGSGYTNSAGGLYILNGGISDGVGTLIQQQVVSSTQSGAADNLNATTSNGWVFIADALGQFGASATALPHQMPSMGYG